MALVGNLRLWTVQELVSSVLLCNHKSIQGETVRNVCENFQYLNMGIFVHILSGKIYLQMLLSSRSNLQMLLFYAKTEVNYVRAIFSINSYGREWLILSSI